MAAPARCQRLPAGAPVRPGQLLLRASSAGVQGSPSRAASWKGAAEHARHPRFAAHTFHASVSRVIERGLTASLRAILHLPERALRILAGPEKHNDRGDVLDLQTQALLRLTELLRRESAPSTES